MTSYELNTTKTWGETVEDLAETFRKWGIREWSIIPHRPRQGDRSVSVAWTDKAGKDQRLSLATQRRAEDNLRALYLGIEAVRLNELRGIGDVVRSVYLALDAPAVTRDPYEVLGIRPDAPPAIVNAAYRALAQALGPPDDKNAEAYKELNGARDRVLAERQASA